MVDWMEMGMVSQLPLVLVEEGIVEEAMREEAEVEALWEDSGEVPEVAVAEVLDRAVRSLKALYHREQAFYLPEAMVEMALEAEEAESS